MNRNDVTYPKITGKSPPMRSVLFRKIMSFSQSIRWYDGIMILLGLIPAFVIVEFIDQYVVNVPFWDIWSRSVSSFAYSSEITLGDFWQLSNEHRMLIPRLINLVIAYVTSLDMITQVYVKVPITGLIFIALYLMYRSKSTSSRSYLIAIPFSLLIFSLTYWPLWIDPRPLAEQLSILGVILCLWAITALPLGWRALGIAAIMATISSLSYASGNATWVVLVMGMWLVGYRKRRYYVVLGILALSILMPYAIDFLQSQTTARSIPLVNIKALGAFGLTFLGAPLGAGRYESTIPARTMGILGVLATALIVFGIYHFDRESWKKLIPWLGLSVWTIINSTITALGRAAYYGTPGAHMPRYIPFQTQFWIAAVALATFAVIEIHQFPENWKPSIRNGLLTFLPIGFLLIITVNYIRANLYMFEEERFDDFTVQLTTGKGCLYWYETADDSCLELLYPHANYIREIMPSLIERNATFLHDEPLALAYATVGAKDPSSTEKGNQFINDEVHDVIFQHPPSELTWRLFLPKDNKNLSLVTGLLVDRLDEFTGLPSNGVIFRITVSSAVEKKDLLSQLVLPKEANHDFDFIEIDLSEFAGQTILITFSTSPGLDDTVQPNYDWALWLQPKLIYD